MYKFSSLSQTARKAALHSGSTPSKTPVPKVDGIRGPLRSLVAHYQDPRNNFYINFTSSKNHLIKILHGQDFFYLLLLD